jgi:hypothetical protein
MGVLQAWLMRSPRQGGVLRFRPPFAEELAFHAHVHLRNSRASPVAARLTGSRLPSPPLRAGATEKGPRIIPYHAHLAIAGPEAIG